MLAFFLERRLSVINADDGVVQGQANHGGQPNAVRVMSDAEEVLARLAAAESAGDQMDIIRTAWGSAGLVELSMAESEEVLTKLGKACSRTEQLAVLTRCSEERLLVCAFDVAVSPLIMTQPTVRHLVKIMRGGVRNGTTAKRLSLALDSLETGCFLSAAQATTLMADAHVDERQSNEWWHVVCARVLDKWNLRDEEHTQVACYYGWDAAFLSRLLRQVEFIRTDGGEPVSAASMPAAELQCRIIAEQSADHRDKPPEMSRQLQNRVLALMGKADHFLYSHSRTVRMYAAQLIAANLGSGSSDTCAICLDECQNGCALWACKQCGNRLHSSCYHDYARKRCKHEVSDDETEGKGKSSPCPYCRYTENPA